MSFNFSPWDDKAKTFGKICILAILSGMVVYATCAYVKFQGQEGTVAEKEDGDEEAENPPSQSGSKESSKASVSRWLKHHVRKVGDTIHELIKKLNEKANTIGLDTRSMDTFLCDISALIPNKLKFVFSFYKHIGRPVYARMTEMTKLPKRTLDDVEGVDDAKAELREVALILDGDGKYMKVEAKLPRGILLVGPPGTGKTLLAHAVAGEARVPFFSIFAEVGTGAAIVTDLFRKATANAPSIVFIDKIEAISMRGDQTTLINHQLHPAFSQLLKEMDKVKEDASMVLVLAATNVICATILDSAMMGSSRFFKKVSVGKPDEDGRRKIFGLYMEDLPMEENETICTLVASLTEGLVGADLENIADESRRLAARRGGELVTCDDVVEAVKRIRSQNYYDTKYK